MNNISTKGVVTEERITLKHTGLTKTDEGKLVKLSANNTVAVCTDGDLIFGVLEVVENEVATVQIAGVVEALMTLLNGDGHSNPAGTVTASTSGAITFADLLDLQMAFTNFESEVLIGNKATIKKLLLIPEFRDPLIGEKFLTEGGEVQYYTAKTRFLKSDLGEDVRRLNQYCRVIARVVVDEWQEDEEWLIETIQPKRIGNFEMIELTLKLPKEGNRIR